MIFRASRPLLLFAGFFLILFWYLAFTMRALGKNLSVNFRAAVLGIATMGLSLYFAWSIILGSSIIMITFAIMHSTKYFV